MNITEKKIVKLAQRASARINQYRVTHTTATDRQFEADVTNIIAWELRKAFSTELQGGSDNG